MIDNWKSRGACPNCGGDTGIEGSSGQCKWCNSELTAANVEVSTLPKSKYGRYFFK